MRAGTRVLVGGAPVNERYAREIGADGYAPNAAEAVEVARAALKG
jgi:5-methyltetrahydrofolate--homocysteine methyltransferase